MILPKYQQIRAGYRIQGSGFRVQGSGFRVQGSGFRNYLIYSDPSTRSRQVGNQYRRSKQDDPNGTNLRALYV